MSYNDVNAALLNAIGTRQRPSWAYPTPENPPKPPPVPSSPRKSKPASTSRLVGGRQTAASTSTPNSTSPQLAMLPSPSPSEEAFADPSALQVASGEQNAASIRQTATTWRNEEGSDMQHIQQMRQAAASGQKRALDQAPFDADKRTRTEAAQGRQCSTAFTLPNQLDVRRSSLPHVQSASPATTPQAQTVSPTIRQASNSQSPFHHHALPQSTTTHTSGVAPENQAPSTRSMPYGSLQQSSGAHQGRNGPQSPIQHQHQPAAWYNKEQCLSALKLFQDSHPILDDRDKRRLDALHQAVNEQDWTYLIMHQYYCIRDFDPKALPMSISNLPGLPSAFRVLVELLDSNATLSPPVLKLLTQFPAPQADLVRSYPQRLMQEESKLRSFIERAVHIYPLRASCEQRRYPPLMRELFYDLGITSTVFQRMVFNATLRYLWLAWRNEQLRGSYEMQAAHLFNRHQVDFYQRLTMRPSYQFQSFEIERREREQEKQIWGLQLFQLCHSMLSNSLQNYQSTQQQTRQLQGHNSYSAQMPVSQVPTQAIPPHTAQAGIHGIRSPGGPRRQRTLPRPPSAPVGQTDLRPSTSRPLLAQQGFRLPQQRLPDPVRLANHQAYLRSPELKAQTGQTSLYQYMKGFLKPPVRLGDASYKVEKWTFDLTQAVLQSVPVAVDSAHGAPRQRQVNEESQLLRLRCVKWTLPILPNEHTWSVTDTCWIPFSYFTFNGVNLQQRQKSHYGKDLPIDLTSYVKEGENTLEIAIMRQREDESYRGYLVAIELLGIKSHLTILNECRTTNYIDANISKAHIRRKLSHTDSDDDDIAIVEGNITINLFDPISASKMCDIPARGKACLHYDCFDLEIFLQTRQRAGDATVADIWKCPICNCDVRPQHLIADGFIEEVRDELRKQGLSRTRAIVVDQSLAWKPKVEALEGVADRDTPDRDERLPSSRQASMHTNTRQTPIHAEVIDLSD